VAARTDLNVNLIQPFTEETIMSQPSPASQRRTLTPEAETAWREFSKTVFKAGALDTKTKQLIAVAVAHVTQCQHCIRAHTQAAQGENASASEIMEAIWVAAEMRAGGAVAHSRHALETLDADNSKD
jgi:AhpD family alkylhydroperoxidase